jgi:hypothetical protein
LIEGIFPFGIRRFGGFQKLEREADIHPVFPVVVEPIHRLVTDRFQVVSKSFLGLTDVVQAPDEFLGVGHLSSLILEF